ncbi:MAG: transcriptional repressor [Candidatus Dormiibacterota bacterium]
MRTATYVPKASDAMNVFRAVSGMKKDGLINRIDLGGGKVHHELSDEHHERVCDSCGRVVGVPGCVLENAAPAVKESTGIVVTSHQLLFSGVCPERVSARNG